MENDFYYRFEQHFRGSREEIKRRQSVYLPILEPLKSIQSPSLTLDLGCGRGEWLELMTENGFSAQGVDLDEAMLQFCAEQGFAVRKADALDCLRSIPDATLSVVSGFHIAEHLPFETLQSLIVEALRALIPGGILILETPNPENLEVGSCNFYADPTHRAPLPPRLLAYLGEDAGFKRVETLRLNQPPKEWYSNPAGIPSLSRVIFGVGPDYAIVAQKIATLETLTAFTWFAEMGNESNSLSARINEFDAELLAIQQETQRAQSEQMARLDEILNSRSWQITAPLRKANAILRKIKPYVKKRLKAVIKTSASFVSKRHRLKPFVLALLAPFPGVKDRLRRAAGLTLGTSAITFQQDVAVTSVPKVMSPRAQKIYVILKQNTDNGRFK